MTGTTRVPWWFVAACVFVALYRPELAGWTLDRVFELGEMLARHLEARFGEREATP